MGESSGSHSVSRDLGGRRQGMKNLAKPPKGLQGLSPNRPLGVKLQRSIAPPVRLDQSLTVRDYRRFYTIFGLQLGNNGI